MRFVAVDMGASGTRFASDDQTLRQLPNNMVFLEEDEKVSLKKNSESFLENLEVVMSKDVANDYFPCRALIGELATRYSASNIRPSGLKNKSDQKVNYISCITAAAAAMLANEVEEASIEMFIALPPAEARVASDKIKDLLVGDYEVRFPRVDRVRRLKITDVTTFEESFLAMLSFFFDSSCRPKEAANEFGTGYILSLDIGASTTDIVVAENMKYLERSGQTYKTGGNIAIDILTDIIRGEYGYDMPFETGVKVMSEGRMALGNKYEDVSRQVRKAKKEYAREIVTNIQNYFRKINIPIQSIRAIMVSGGGSMQSQYINGEGQVVVTVPPMSDFITEQLKDICDSVEVRGYEGNPRFANISGLLTRVNLEFKKRDRKK